MEVHGGGKENSNPFKKIKNHGGELVIEKPPSILKNKNVKIKTVKQKNKVVKFNVQNNQKNKKILKTVNLSVARTNVNSSAQIDRTKQNSKISKKLEFNKMDLLISESIQNQNKLLNDIPD